MADYYTTLLKIKRKMMTRTRWTSEDVRKLLRNEKDDVHTEVACRIMLSNLRSNPDTRSKFLAEIQEYEAESGKKVQAQYIRKLWTKREIELIKNHIVPVGRTVTNCITQLNKLGIKTDSVPYSRWSFESERAKEVEAKPVEKTAPTPKPEVKTEVSELSMNIAGVKAMFTAGMDYNAIAKVIGKDVNTVIALLKVAEAFA